MKVTEAIFKANYQGSQFWLTQFLAVLPPSKNARLRLGFSFHLTSRLAQASASFDSMPIFTSHFLAGSVMFLIGGKTTLRPTQICYFSAKEDLRSGLKEVDFNQ